MKFSKLIVYALFITLATLSPALANELPDSTFPLEEEMNPCVNGVSQKDTEGNLLVRQHCTNCHSENRIMSALQAMHGGQYDKEVKNIISRKIRLTNGDIPRQDGKKIIEYLVSIWSRQKAGCKTTS